MHTPWPRTDLLLTVAPQLDKLKQRKQQDIDRCRREADDDAERERGRQKIQVLILINYRTCVGVVEWDQDG